MTDITFFVLYVLICAVTFCHYLWWLRKSFALLRRPLLTVLFSLLFLGFAITPVIGFYLQKSGFQHFMAATGNFWLGYMACAGGVMAVSLLLQLICARGKLLTWRKKRDRKQLRTQGFLCLFSSLAIFAYGVWNARFVQYVPYELQLTSEAASEDSLTMVFLSDLHMGENVGCTHLNWLVGEINAREPDLVLIGGDLFDHDYDDMEDPKAMIRILQRINSTYGVYAVYGDADASESFCGPFCLSEGEAKADSRMDDFLEAAGITLLQDQGTAINDTYYLWGRSPASADGQEECLSPEEISEQVPADKQLIVLQHQPIEIEELSDAGTALTLCGHVMHGQNFPLNLAASLQWTYDYGLKNCGDMSVITTGGAGLAGLPLRVGTDTEISVITLK